MESLLSIEEISISPIRIALDLVLVFILSRITVWHYEKYCLANSFSNTKHSFSIVAMSTVLIISVVKSSLALSLGLVGALSIVRFRTPIKDPEELGYLFFLIGSGLAAGAEQEVALIVSAPIILFCLYLVSSRKDSNGESGYLYIDVHSSKYDDVVNVLKNSEKRYIISRFVKNKEFYSIDIKVDSLNFEELKVLADDIGELGVEKVTFLANE